MLKSRDTEDCVNFDDSVQNCSNSSAPELLQSGTKPSLYKLFSTHEKQFISVSNIQSESQGTVTWMYASHDGVIIIRIIRTVISGESDHGDLALIKM